jgi:DNA repair protein RadC
VGPLEVEYDRVGTRAKRVLTAGAGGLSADELLAVFLVFGVWEPRRNAE